MILSATKCDTNFENSATDQLPIQTEKSQKSNARNVGSAFKQNSHSLNHCMHTQLFTHRKSYYIYIYIYIVGRVWVQLSGDQGAKACVILVLLECIWNNTSDVSLIISLLFY